MRNLLISQKNTEFLEGIAKPANTLKFYSGTVKLTINSYVRIFVVKYKTKFF